MRFYIDDQIWDIFPELHVGIVIARGFNNRMPTWHEITDRLTRSASQAVDKLGDQDVTEHPSVAPWREAYLRFGMKPSRYRSSIESLLRAAKSGGVRSINPLVDIYNGISLRYLLPCGGEDLKTLQGDLRLTLAEGGEEFTPLGSSEASPAHKGEVIYRDDLGVVCRAFNWRESERAKLTAESSEAVLLMEALAFDQDQQLLVACGALVTLIERHLGGATSMDILNATHSEISL
jgi:DNA/RNA-binding domain of Phe-tRNA-synthetase-like protein